MIFKNLNLVYVWYMLHVQNWPKNLTMTENVWSYFIHLVYAQYTKKSGMWTVVWLFCYATGMFNTRGYKIWLKMIIFDWYLDCICCYGMCIMTFLCCAMRDVCLINSVLQGFLVEIYLWIIPNFGTFLMKLSCNQNSVLLKPANILSEFVPRNRNSLPLQLFLCCL